MHPVASLFASPLCIFPFSSLSLAIPLSLYTSSLLVSNVLPSTPAHSSHVHAAVHVHVVVIVLVLVLVLGCVSLAPFMSSGEHSSTRAGA